MKREKPLDGEAFRDLMFDPPAQEGREGGEAVPCVQCGRPVEEQRRPPAYGHPTCYACLPPPEPLPVCPPVERPAPPAAPASEACRCRPGGWLGTPGAICCGGFQPARELRAMHLCANCGHGQGCHATPPAPPPPQPSGGVLWEGEVASDTVRVTSDGVEFRAFDGAAGEPAEWWLVHETVILHELAVDLARALAAANAAHKADHDSLARCLAAARAEIASFPAYRDEIARLARELSAANAARERAEVNEASEEARADALNVALIEALARVAALEGEVEKLDAENDRLGKSAVEAVREMELVSARAAAFLEPTRRSGREGEE